MNDFYLGETGEKKSQLIVDLNYNLQKKKGSRKTMFQLISSKLNSKQALNNNPKDIFNASNKINSILSKNLKSIYKENKDEKTKDFPLYKNVNYLINKNNNGIKFDNENNAFSKEILRLNNFNRNDSLFKTSINTSTNIRNQLNYSPIHRNDDKYSSQKYGSGIFKNIKIMKNKENKINKRTKSSKFINNNYINRKSAQNYGFEPLFGKDKPKISKIFSNCLLLIKEIIQVNFVLIFIRQIA